MKPIKTLLVLAAMLAPLSLAPAVAEAQPGGYYAQPPTNQLPGGFHNRQGRMMFGGSLGLGGMSDRGGDIECINCDYGTVAGMGSLHLGGFLGPRVALMAEVQANIQTLATDGFDDTQLVQSALMGAVQYWITPQLWIKGGLGFANIQVEDTYYGTVGPPKNGLAIMGAVGFELLSAPYFSIDLQGRLLNGSYDGETGGIQDNSITAASIGIGLNWF